MSRYRLSHSQLNALGHLMAFPRGRLRVKALSTTFPSYWSTSEPTRNVCLERGWVVLVPGGEEWEITESGRAAYASGYDDEP